MQKIARLSESVINQIAAGEVVENPASIIKELIENSLDAGSTQIRVTIRGGGQILIIVEDDGCGMSQEDAILSLERHATSKIRKAEDLCTLATMGFRGEAIAAIASVSQFEIKTSDGTGTHIKVNGGQVEEIAPCARNQGTTITVRSLFYNVPARKKFQKSMSANTAQVTKVIEILSAANPEVSFTYTSQDEKIYHFPKQTRKERIEAIFGKFDHVGESEDFWGLFSAPHLAKSQRRGQLLFVNRRPVFSPLISKAVQMGYGTRLNENMHPPFILFLEIDPSLVDVNVHPQKKEVRFAEESILYSKVEKFVGDLFQREPVFSSPIVFEEVPFLLQDVPLSFPQYEPSVLKLEIPPRPLFVFGKYLLMEKEGLFLVDLHGAFARVFFEDIKEKRIEKQNLLWPLEVVEKEEVLEDLQKMGFECRLIGEKTIAIDSIPSSMEASDFPIFYEAWKDGKRLETASTRFARTGTRKYSLDDAIALWNRLQKCKDSFYDPLGKRIWNKIEQGDLESWLLKESTSSKKQ